MMPSMRAPEVAMLDVESLAAFRAPVSPPELGDKPAAMVRCEAAAVLLQLTPTDTN
jgi:hypothetical protein